MACRILIADDDTAFADTLSIRLRSAGYETTVVHEGIRVMEAARQDRPALIILDLKMPVGMGLDVLQRLKKRPETSAIPVIILTGTWPEMEKESLAAGAAAFFPKPYDAQQLLAKIKDLV